MKFRSIFILFNIILTASFLFIFLMPLFVVGPAVSGDFFSRTWPLAVLFVAILAFLNGFFLANRKVFLFVEREDWNGLSAYLVEQVFVKRRYRGQHIRLLVNAYLLQSDLEGIARLQAELEERNPALLARNAVLFVVPFLLKGDSKGAIQFAGRFSGNAAVQDREWLAFYEGLSHAYNKDKAGALDRLAPLVQAKDSVLCALSCNVLSSACSGTDSEVDAKVAARKQALVKRFSKESWAKEIERARGEVHVVVLSKMLDEASAWLFG